jgi:hypothetical protein
VITKQHQYEGESRRNFLKQLSGGMFLSTLGVGLSSELGLASTTWLEDESSRELDFGGLSRWADLLTHTPLKKLQPALVREFEAGAKPAQLIAAGALANARAFGGEDYEGYHAFMALMPSYEMSTEMEGRESWLPVMKVLYRTTARIQKLDRDEYPMLKSHPKAMSIDPKGPVDGRAVVACVKLENKAEAEARFDSLVRKDAKAAVEQLIPVVCEEVDVHRVVLAWRGWDLLRLTGPEHARTLMRQSIRQCVEREANMRQDPIRQGLPKVLQSCKVLETPLGHRPVDDAWIERLARSLVDASREQGAGLVAGALEEGSEPDSIGQALSLASTYLMLRQRGRDSASSGKPVGSVHGAGTGVHSSDTAAAWRGMSRFGSDRQCKMALIAGGYHVSGQSQNVGRDFFDYESIKVESRESADLLGMLNECIRSQDQAGAAAAASCYTKLGHPVAELIKVLRDVSLRSDGALHAEKYYRTQLEAMTSDRASFRMHHAAALARVCASESFMEAAGRRQALDLI